MKGRGASVAITVAAAGAEQSERLEGLGQFAGEFLVAWCSDYDIDGSAIRRQGIVRDSAHVPLTA